MGSICDSLSAMANRCDRGVERACKTETGMLKLVGSTCAAAIAAGLFAAIIGASAPGVFLMTAIVGIGVFGAIAYDYGAPLGGILEVAKDGWSDVKRDFSRAVSREPDVEEVLDEVGKEIGKAADAVVDGLNSLFETRPAPRTYRAAPRYSRQQKTDDDCIVS